MNTSSLLLVLPLVAASLVEAAPAPVSQPVAQVSGTVADRPVHGPTKHEVKERYGKLNKSSVKFSATETIHLIKVQLGEKPADKPDYLELSVNGEKMVLDDRYPYPFIACFVKLKKENTYEVVVKDAIPAGFRRPALVPKFVFVMVLTAPQEAKDIRGSFGLMKWEGLKDVVDLFAAIKSPAASKLAMEAASLQMNTGSRAEAMRNLVDLKDRASADYLQRMYTNHLVPEEVRAEAAIGLGLLGGKQSIPLLMINIFDHDERMSTSAARALSFYPEEETQEDLIKALERLDMYRKGAAIRTIINAGWKPVNTMIKLAESSDPQVSGIAIGILGGMREPRATDALLKLLAEPGKSDKRPLITALAETRDPRAVDALIALAANPERRSGIEVDLGDALANLGDPKAADTIADMAKNAPSPFVQNRLSSAYRRLTGKPL